MDGHYHFLWLHITRQAYTLTRRLGIKGAVHGPLRSKNLNVDNYSQRLIFKVLQPKCLFYTFYITLNSFLYDCYKITLDGTN